MPQVAAPGRPKLCVGGCTDARARLRAGLVSSEIRCFELRTMHRREIDNVPCCESSRRNRGCNKQWQEQHSTRSLSPKSVHLLRLQHDQYCKAPALRTAVASDTSIIHLDPVVLVRG